jgi:hypothetical protein
VVESVPVDPKDLYSKTITWVSPEKTVGVKREYYDKRKSLLKQLAIGGVENISGVWVITGTEMSNVQKKTRTRLEFADVKINSGIPEGDFSERAMTKGL